MCTVTFIPQSDGGFILSSNRDESPLRSQCEVTTKVINGKKVLFPSDHKGGTWLAASDQGDVICLLNGAFVKHKHQPPYAMSRGIMLLSFFEYDSISDFLFEFSFDGIEPFTLIIYTKCKLYEYRWDGFTKHINILNAAATHLWSSSTLYNDDIRKQRQQWFDAIAAQYPHHDLDFIKYLHRNGGSGDPINGYIMNREDIVKTVSISHIQCHDDRISLLFEDLENNLTKKAATHCC